MAIEEKFTDLPGVANATMDDIICAVQGYVSPSNLGTSVQETLQQVYNLFAQNIILFNAGNPNGLVAGTTYQFLWDTVDLMLWICTTTGTASTAVWTKTIQLTAGTNIGISQAGATITISASGAAGFTWSNVTGTTVTMGGNNGFIANNAGLVTLTLPPVSNIGDVLEIVGNGAGGWIIAQTAGQQIHVGSSASTLGVGGSVASTNRYDSINLVCTVADTIWVTNGAPQSAGLTIV